MSVFSLLIDIAVLLKLHLSLAWLMCGVTAKEWSWLVNCRQPVGLASVPTELLTPAYHCLSAQCRDGAEELVSSCVYRRIL